MRFRPAAWTALASALLLALVAACGSVAPPAGDGGPIPAIDPYGGNPATEGTPHRGGTLVLGEDREIISFDPTVQNTNPAADAVYDLLMRLTPDGHAVGFLARSMSTPDGGRTWRMDLRPGVLFSDGTSLDAQAVIINTQRHIDKAASPAHTWAVRIVSMRAPDSLTVEFTLRSPLGDFPVLFAEPIFTGTLGMIISPTALRRYGNDIGNHPVGAGPFEFVSWTRDSKLELVRNPNYWQRGLPYLDRLEFRPLPDTETRYASIQGGDVDFIFAAYNQELVRGLRNPRLRVYYGPGDSGEYLIFNFNRAPFNDHGMREALIRAIDLRALSVSQYNNRLVTATSVFAEGSPLHTQAASDAWPRYDPVKAKQLVDAYRAAGHDPDFTLKTTTSRQPFAEFIQAELAAIGVTVHVQTYDLAEYSSAVVQSNDFQLTTTVAPLTSPFPGLTQLFGTGGSGNFGRYSNPEVDRLLADAAATGDPARRTTDYQQVELQVNRDLAVAWLSRSYLATITKKDVRGIIRYLSRDMSTRKSGWTGETDELASCPGGMGYGRGCES
jgi:peptide/nickel transport system substrate-binding protein